RSDRSIARSRRRTSTASTGKTALAQSLDKPGIERAAEIRLIEVLAHDALGHLDAALRLTFRQQDAARQHTVPEHSGSVFEDDEIHRIRRKPVAGVGCEIEPFSPAAARVEPVAEDHREIHIGTRSGPRSST